MKVHKNFLRINLIFIFIFLNIWDYVAAREYLNGMVIGVFLFGPTAFLWFVSTFRAIIILTLLSLLEFVILAIFVVEGLHFGIVGLNLRSLFWVPYLLMATLNGFWGLSIYSEYRENKSMRAKKIN